MTTVLVPVKALAGVKNRLASVLSPEQRCTLVGAMLRDVLAACTRADGVQRCVVVSRDADVRSLASSCGAEAWAEPRGGGLNAAVCWASERAVADGAQQTLVIMGDCPQAAPADVDRLLATPARAGVVFVPSLDGTGTNAMLRRPGDAMPTAFGPNSLEKHAWMAAVAGLRPMYVRCPSLALDVDTPTDLVRLAESTAPAASARLAHEWLMRVHA